MGFSLSTYLLAAALGASAATGTPAPASQQLPSLSQAELGKLIEALRGEPPRPLKVRLQAALIMGRIAGTAGLPALVECIEDDPEYAVRSACTLALGNLSDVRAVEPLVARLDDPDDLVREEARRSLLKLASPEALPYLQAARERGSVRVRAALVDVVARIRAPEAGLLVAELLGDPEERVRVEAEETLKMMDPGVADGLLLKGLGHPNYRVRAACARQLGVRKLPEAAGPLADLVSSAIEAIEVQLEARAALRELKSTFDVPKLAAQARDGAAEPAARSRAMIQLSTAAAGDALQISLDVLADPAIVMRGAAALALSELGDPRGLAPLREARRKSENAPIAKQLDAAIRRLENGSAR